VFDQLALSQAWGAGTREAPIKAVLIFTDPSDWYQDLQIIADAVLGHGVVGARGPLDAPKTSSKHPPRPPSASQEFSNGRACKQDLSKRGHITDGASSDTVFSGARHAEAALLRGSGSVASTSVAACHGASQHPQNHRTTAVRAVATRAMGMGGNDHGHMPWSSHAQHSTAQHVNAQCRFQSGGGRAALHRHPVRVIASHRDLLWSTDFPTPRFGLGAFVAALETLLAAVLGPSAPPIECFGKPTEAPYQLAEKLLQQQTRRLGEHFCHSWSTMFFGLSALI
jgi:hypothetical protein